MDHVLTAQTSREPKEQVLLVDQTHATSDRESKEMVPVSIVSCITLSVPTEDAAQNQLANQWLNISLWMVSVAHVHSTNKQEEMVSHAQLTQPRSFQIHR
jgi:Flp pilus assembly protein CpaB